MARKLSKAGAARRAKRKKMGITDVRKASKKQIAKARKAKALPGKGSSSGFESKHPRAARGRFKKK